MELQNLIVNNINIALMNVFVIPEHGIEGIIFDNTTLGYIMQPTYCAGHSLF
jgi:hypothetical protein